MNKITFKLIEKSNLPEILPLLKECDKGIEPETVAKRFDAMLKTDYDCVGVYDGDELIGICGLWRLEKYYVGTHIEMDNVYIKPGYRCKGVGRQLVEWIENYAKECGCEAIELNCYEHNAHGQKFWEGVGYKPIGIHFQKKL